MAWYWIAQMVFNVGLCVCVYVLSRQKRELEETQAKATAFLNVMQARVEEYEEKLRKYDMQIKYQLERLLRVCEKAERIIDETRVPTIQLAATEEQKDLMALVRAADEQIPSVRDVERTNERLSKECGWDLKTILSDQLA